MILARRRALFIAIALAFAVAGALAIAGRSPSAPKPRPASERPTLLLLTSLPIVFGEGFTLDGGSAALKALETRYRVVPISVTDEADLARGRLLLMAHPQAQPAEDLVALDEWVRRGGRVLLLADPLLEWPSSRSLGDRLRPPPMFMDTGLLGHWGLRLDAPDERGRVSRKLAGYDIVVDSPGNLHGGCEVASDRLVAHCSIGRGAATVIADADLLDKGRLGPAARHNLDALLAELARIEPR